VAQDRDQWRALEHRAELNVGNFLSGLATEASREELVSDGARVGWAL
jgi:hypothetical protein